VECIEGWNVEGWNVEGWNALRGLRGITHLGCICLLGGLLDGRDCGSAARLGSTKCMWLLNWAGWLQVCGLLYTNACFLSGGWLAAALLDQVFHSVLGKDFTIPHHREISGVGAAPTCCTILSHDTRH
jgi:hypothetical protein